MVRLESDTTTSMIFSGDLGKINATYQTHVDTVRGQTRFHQIFEALLESSVNARFIVFFLVSDFHSNNKPTTTLPLPIPTVPGMCKTFRGSFNGSQASSFSFGNGFRGENQEATEF